MPLFSDYEEAMIAGLKNIEGIRNVDEFSGALDATALKKIAPKDAGVLLVSLGGAPDRTQPDTGQLAWVCRTGAFIVSRNARGSVARTRAARLLAQNIMLNIRGFQWDLPDVFGAEIEKLENRSAGKADEAGYGIWLLVWKQTIYLDELPEDDAPAIKHVTVQTGDTIEQEIDV